jgi:epoxyqueuosine reductase
MRTAAELADFLPQAARRAGFDLAGIAPAAEFAEHRYFPSWIAAGRAGQMHYLAARDERNQLKRAALASVAPWARSVIACALNYNTAPPPAPDASPRACISRYAWAQRDYHDVLLDALRRLDAELRAFAAAPVETRCYVDTGPLLERAFARHAGLGWIGKNTCLINQRLGSWLFLGVILTSLELPPALPAPDRCGSCRRCLDVCPTAAFPAPYQLDASRCLSYLTIEHRGDIPEDLRPALGLHVFGCDLCQDVCPWNRRAPISLLPDLQPRPPLVAPDLAWLATLGEEEFRTVFRGSAVKRAKHTGLRRNAVIALGNSSDARYAPLLAALSSDPDELVARHARWALGRLRSLGASARPPDRQP